MNQVANEVIHELHVYGAMKFPHYIRHEVGDKTTVTKKVGMVYDEKKKEMVPDFRKYTAAANGVYSICCKPDKHVQVGEKFKSLYIAGVTYTITEIVEVRPAKGAWSFVDFKPEVVSVRATIDSINV